ncbi:MAG: hypothetical protein VCB25_10015 [Myxococcota bacterium]
MLKKRARGAALGLLAMIWWLPGCVGSPAARPTAESLAGTAAKVIVIAPLNVALELPATLRTSTEIVSAALIHHLEAHGKSVVRLDDQIGRRLWIESAREIRRSGAPKTFENAARVFARKIQTSIDHDAVIIPSLYLQNAAIQSNGSARWDGASQKISFIGQSRWKIDLPPFTTISAASLLLTVLDRDGDSIHSKRTGLELIEHMAIHSKRSKGHDQKTWRLTRDNPAIEDPKRIAAAIKHVLFPFLPK